jgi:hypothetical protein
MTCRGCRVPGAASDRLMREHLASAAGATLAAALIVESEIEAPL